MKKLEGYPVTGKPCVVSSKIVVFKHAGRGGGYMKFVRKIGARGWWATWHRTRAAATGGNKCRIRR